MAQDLPLTDTARVNFSGMSEEAFENLGQEHIGDIRIFTIRARVKGFSAVDMAESGVRRMANLKVLKVVEGVSEKVREDDEAQPSLFDSPAKKTQQDDDEGETVDEPSNVVPFEGGPQFSADDN